MAKSPAASDSVGVNMLAQWLATLPLYEATTSNVAMALEKVKGKVFEKSRPTSTITISNHWMNDKRYEILTFVADKSFSVISQI